MTARDRFIIACAREGATAEDLRRIFRAAATLQRLACAELNGEYPYPKETAKPRARCPLCHAETCVAEAFKAGHCPDCHTRRSIARYVGGHMKGWLCHFQEDARGAILSLRLPSEGASSHPVPTRSR